MSALWVQLLAPFVPSFWTLWYGALSITVTGEGAGGWWVEGAKLESAS